MPQPPAPFLLWLVDFVSATLGWKWGMGSSSLSSDLLFLKGLACLLPTSILFTPCKRSVSLSSLLFFYADSFPCLQAPTRPLLVLCAREKPVLRIPLILTGNHHLQPKDRPYLWVTHTKVSFCCYRLVKGAGIRGTVRQWD